MNGRPGPDHELDNPRAHMVQRDLHELRPGCLRGFRAELERWAAVDELPPSAGAVLALLSVVPRPAGRPDGMGLQASRKYLARVTGYCPRQVAYALDALQAEGLVARHRRLVRVKPWHDARGTLHAHADARAVTYLTKAGAKRLVDRGLWSERIPGRGRVRRLGGVVGFLLRKLGPALRKRSRRVAAVASDCTPTKTRPYRNHHHASASGGSACGQQGGARPIGRALHGPEPHAPAPPGSSSAVVRGPGDGMCKSRTEERDELVDFCLSRTVHVGRGRRSSSPITHVRELLVDAWRDHPSSRRSYVEWFEPVRREVTRRLKEREFRPWPKTS